ncbi:MAG: hypothetical protein IJA35_00790 [Clostridia bacterium]|nr:hypothetical protein [Oscillospiraceae bacterium]MBQ3551686.1 hypothetical protein [Clostridia bacterium]
MTLEQEVASIMAFALRSAGNPSPYYYDVPEQFEFPAMYFPQPEIVTRGETFRTYASDYAWYINVMCKTTEEAHEIGLGVLTKLKQARNLVPIIDGGGSETGTKLRLKDPMLKKIDTGVVQLTIEWTSRRPYDAEDVLKTQRFFVEHDIKK